VSRSTLSRRPTGSHEYGWLGPKSARRIRSEATSKGLSPRFLIWRRRKSRTGGTVPSGMVGRRVTSATSSSIGSQLRESAVAVISE
jgi:hypothetical protein